ncbi:permease [Vermiculatibacterium agrestimuris]|uniref:permease n=1 Tax=Vermiculatibacterium agrestimuris TaxID=2941519 RepID=UPI00203D9712|nr:permease [Vermiculatibacterium agrestimuris]
MLGYLTYFSIVLALFVIGDWLGIWTKAKLSSIFVVLISFLLLFLFKIVPADIIDQAGLTAAASWATPMLVFHMGTMINLRQLIDEWRTVVTSVIGMIAAIIGILLVIPLIGRDAALVSIPVINGALVATNIMTEAANAKGLELAAMLPAVVFAVQKFVGTPIVSRCGLIEARNLLADYREKKAQGITLSAAPQAAAESKKVKFYEKHDRFYTANACIFITVLGGLISAWLGTVTPINYSIIALVLSVLLCELGLIPPKVLDKGKTSGFITMVVFAAIIPALAKISMENIATLAFYVVVIFAATIIASLVIVCVLPCWKVMGSRSLAFGIAMCQMLGFPSTFLISNEVALALSDTEEEKEYVLAKIMPRFVVAGLASVTTLSIIVAGIFANIL